MAEEELPPAWRRWRYLPAFAYTVETAAGPVTSIDRGVARVLPPGSEPRAECASIEDALLRSDIGGRARARMSKILRKYPEQVQLALLRRQWDVMRPEMEAIAAIPDASLGRVVEGRLRAHSLAAMELRGTDELLSASRCDLAFDDDAVDELGSRAAKLALDACRELLTTGNIVLFDIVKRLKKAFVADVLSQLRVAFNVPASQDDLDDVSGTVCVARVFTSLAGLMSEVRSRAARAGDDSPMARAYGFCAALAVCADMVPPLPGRGGVTVGGALRRLCDPRWWRRALRRVYARRAESALRHIGMVSKFAGLYVSEPTFERVARQRIRASAYLDLAWLANEHGELLPLADAYEASVSNPKLRRLELMTRMAGCERFAQAVGDEVIVCTATLPSRFHCILSRSGERNPAFDGSDVPAGQRQLQSSWAKVRAALGRAGVSIYGFRCTEPNHDGTVHWHLMICVRPCDAETVRQTIRRYFLDELDPDEPGASEHRIDFIDIDSSRGSAVGYLAKYISKNIDGQGVGVDTNDGHQSRDAADTSQRVVAHARTNLLRQFQSFGLPSVTVWRELRRLRVAPGGSMNELWRAASEDHAFDAFIRLMGGPGRRALDRPLRVHYAPATIAGCYGELNARRIRGLKFENVVIPTREFEWRLILKSRPSPPWTRVNNCTHSPKLTAIDVNGCKQPGDGMGRDPPDDGELSELWRRFEAMEGGKDDGSDLSPCSALAG